MSTYKVNDRVRHRVFGDGIVTRIQSAGLGTQLYISFDRYGERILFQEFADRNMEKIGEKP